MNSFSRSQPWESIFRKPTASPTSWAPAASTLSLTLIENASLSKSSHILDLGGSDSFLADQLCQKGYSRISVAEVSDESLDSGREWLGDDASRINWVTANGDFFHADTRIDVWHDRSVFGFLEDPLEISLYAEMAAAFVRRGGMLVIGVPCGADAEQGKGYDLLRLAAAFAPDFELEESSYENHFSPFGKQQRFVFGRFVRR